MRRAGGEMQALQGCDFAELQGVTPSSSRRRQAAGSVRRNMGVTPPPLRDDG